MPSSPMTRGAFADLMFPGLNEAYLIAFNEYPEEYNQFLNVGSSSMRQEDDYVAAGFGLVPEKGEGDQPIFDVMKTVGTKRYTHLTYSMGYEVTEECVEDELYGIMKQGSKTLATAVKQTVDTLAAAVLNDAFTAGTGVDGSFLCATDHTPVKSGSDQANKPTVDCDFDPVALDNATLEFEEWRNDNDLPIMIKPKYVISGPKQRKIIGQTLGGEKMPFTADNTINAVREWELQRIILHYLDDEDVWFVTSRPADHFMKLFWRVRPRFRGYDDPNTGNARFLVRFRLSVGFTHWWGVYGSSGG